MKDGTQKKIERWGMFFGAAAYGFINAPFIVVREIIQSRKRMKLKKGLLEWKKLIREMEKSGEYTEEQLNNIILWFAEATRQYSEMF